MSEFDPELQNLIASYPKNLVSLPKTIDGCFQNRPPITMAQVESVLMVKSVGSQAISEMKKEHLKCRFVYPEDLNAALELLVSQVGGHEDDIECVHRIHKLWSFFLLPLWCDEKNYNVLQSSAHVDIETAVALGSYFERRSRDWVRESSGNVFKQFRGLLSSIDRPVCSKFSLGCALDATRTFLAEWVIKSSKNELISSWDPEICDGEFNFSVSDYICDADYQDPEQDIFYLQARIVWECQQALHDHLAEEGCTPSSVVLMMFFLAATHN